MKLISEITLTDYEKQNYTSNEEYKNFIINELAMRIANAIVKDELCDVFLSEKPYLNLTTVRMEVAVMDNEHYDELLQLTEKQVIVLKTKYGKLKTIKDFLTFKRGADDAE